MNEMIEVFCPFCGHDTGEFTYTGETRCIQCLNCDTEFTVETSEVIPVEEFVARAETYFEDDFVTL